MVTIIAIDSDGGISTTTFDLVVENVTPIVTINFGTVTVTEGEVASNWGTAVDPGDDTYSLEASIGVLTDNLDGTWAWSFDSTNGPSESQTVIITATDSDVGVTVATFELIVDNVAPGIVLGNSLVTVDEGQLATNSGTYNDPGDDSITLETSIGMIVDNLDGTWSWSFGAINGPADSQMVTITATDSDGGASMATFELVVNNLDPNIAVDCYPVRW